MIVEQIQAHKQIADVMCQDPSYNCVVNTQTVIIVFKLLEHTD